MMRPPQLLTAGASGTFPRAQTGRYRPIEIAVPGDQAAVRPIPVDPRRLPAEALTRTRRAGPPVEDDADLLGYLLLALMFLLAVWR